MVHQGPRRASTDESRRAIFDQATAIVAREFARPLRIESVAERVAVSPRQLQRVFSDVCELGFRSYLRQVRMSRAAELLVGTELPVSDIALRVGYRDPSQFSKAFRRTYGTSPSRMRAAPRADESGRVAPSDSVSGVRGGVPQSK